jgi:hypothetical protein
LFERCGEGTCLDAVDENEWEDGREVARLYRRTVVEQIP